MIKLFPLLLCVLLWVACSSDEGMMLEEMQSELCEIPVNESLLTTVSGEVYSQSILAEDTLHVELASDTLMVRYNFDSKSISFDLELETGELLCFRAAESSSEFFNQLYTTPPAGTALITLDTIEKVKCGKVNGSLWHSEDNSKAMSTSFRVYIDTIN